LITSVPVTLVGELVARQEEIVLKGSVLLRLLGLMDQLKMVILIIMQNVQIKVHVTDKVVNVSVLQDLKGKDVDANLALTNVLDMEPVNIWEI
jgi:hypothetical protein